MWEDLVKKLEEIHQKYPKITLYICGHSLGGALAVLAWSYLLLNSQQLKFLNRVAAVYTFGQPRVGNNAFTNIIELLSDFTWKTEYVRFALSRDPVARVPPALLGFRHFGTHVRISPIGDLSVVSTFYLKLG